MGRKKVKIEKECPVCKKTFETYPARPSRTCSRRCMGIYQTGEKNPNYGTVWDEEQRKRLSDYRISIRDIVSEQVKSNWKNNEIRRLKASKTMSNTMSGNFGEKNPFFGKTHTDDIKSIISKKSKAKFTDDFKKQFRVTMEIAGHWIPLENKTDREIYFVEADWIDRMFDIVPNGIEMLNLYGIFDAVKNNNGVVRDHIVGRRYGFIQLVYPEILRHPCNCQILLQRDNVSKGQKNSDRPDCVIELEDLFKKIENYSGEWKEQEYVVSLINKYRSGGRWSREQKGGCL